MAEPRQIVAGMARTAITVASRAGSANSDVLSIQTLQHRSRVDAYQVAITSSRRRQPRWALSQVSNRSTLFEFAAALGLDLVALGLLRRLAGDVDAAHEGDTADVDHRPACADACPLGRMLERAHDADAVDVDGGVLGDGDLAAAKDRDHVDGDLALGEPGVAQVDFPAAQEHEGVEGLRHHPVALAGEAAEDR